MAELTAELFRGYFGGSWSGRISKNGEFQREIVFNWPELRGKFSSLGTEPGMIAPPGIGVQGGYGELQFTSQELIDGVTVLHGTLHECKQEGDVPTDHIALCEMYNQDSFKYCIRSFRKGLVEIAARRIRTAKELNELLENQAQTVIPFEEISRI